MKGFFILVASAFFLAACASTTPEPEAQTSPLVMVTYTLNDGKDWEKVSAGLQGWGDGVADFSLANEQANVRIKKQASNLWHIQLKRPLYLFEDIKYEISVEASASEPSKLSFTVQQDGGEYATYFQRTELVGVEKKQFTYEFVMPKDEKKAAFAIMFGDGRPGVSYSLNNIKFNSTY
ncbi:MULTISPECIES: carbohydrate binding domain-containing protein [unclassified Agarivorans]|uniref:carbohydrate binding domain-containing protein n=1 Tax=unclassified Agarivorans TaxID=2636026 RepID=UPI0026E1ED96|nr:MULTISPECIES: carbohydrate binding domain-containing protein [unclassified Agarivorans]MDO6686532.1 carbohydrate binding domain-containing protein [Agarivorans sp. 3_MG-2023]MDO6715350.1 carbohydrate binding domain-containing protein [Agarivorans sp. 2_MG-2023]